MIATTYARYRHRYPRQGNAAILCEGDLAGYELDLLEKWSAINIDRAYVDVWPCGTKEAIRGVVDAIGRCVPVFVIEDRDSRTLDQAEKECNKKTKDREKRGVQIGFWRAWRRHEIENYLIEPAILVPSLASAFEVSESEVNDRLAATIERSRIDQAAQFALEHLRAQLPWVHDHVQGLPRKGTRPRWDNARCEIIEPQVHQVEQKLREISDGSCKGFSSRVAKINADIVLRYFQERATKWAAVSIGDTTWRTEWAGKELLHNLYRWLAGQYGWPLERPTNRQRVNWDELCIRGEDGKLEREIAATLQPKLVSAFLNFLNSQGDDEIHQEWNDLVAGIKRCI